MVEVIDYLLNDGLILRCLRLARWGAVVAGSSLDYDTWCLHTVHFAITLRRLVARVSLGNSALHLPDGAWRHHLMPLRRLASFA